MYLSPDVCWGCPPTVYQAAVFLFISLGMLATGMILATGENRICRKVGLVVYGVSLFTLGTSALGIVNEGIVWSPDEPSSPFLMLIFFVVSTGAILISWRLLFRTLDSETDSVE